MHNYTSITSVDAGSPWLLTLSQAQADSLDLHDQDPRVAFGLISGDLAWLAAASVTQADLDAAVTHVIALPSTPSLYSWREVLIRCILTDAPTEIAWRERMKVPGRLRVDYTAEFISQAMWAHVIDRMDKSEVAEALQLLPYDKQAALVESVSTHRARARQEEDSILAEFASETPRDAS